MRRRELVEGDEVLVKRGGWIRPLRCEVVSLEPAGRYWPTSVRVMTPHGREMFVSLRDVIAKTDSVKA